MTTEPIAGIVGKEETMLERITADADKMGGVPCIRGLRVPVSTVVGMVADGMSFKEILEAYPDLVAASYVNRDPLAFLDPGGEAGIEVGIVVIEKRAIRSIVLPALAAQGGGVLRDQAQ